MVDPINDIVRQAHQGSISAIIQVLNEKLADSGIRTRAMFVQGILQLLCEAAKPEQLEQSTVVPQIRQILESLQPRNVYRVNINSRIVREQQLLWLEEIGRDSENQLLWTEELKLRRPNFLQQWLQDLKDSPVEATRSDWQKHAPKRLVNESHVFWRGLIGGASLSVFCLMLGWALYNWLDPKLTQLTQLTQTGATPSESPSESKPQAGNANSPTASPSPASGALLKQDPFAEAVRLAEATVSVGQQAQTSADWLDVAARWQKASDLMSQVPSEDTRYPLAQDRVLVYRQNSEDALQRAQQ